MMMTIIQTESSLFAHPITQLLERESINLNNELDRHSPIYILQLLLYVYLFIARRTCVKYKRDDDRRRRLQLQHVPKSEKTWCISNTLHTLHTSHIHHNTRFNSTHTRCVCVLLGNWIIQWAHTLSGDGRDVWRCWTLPTAL